jgi:hypothetical protein
MWQRIGTLQVLPMPSMGSTGLLMFVVRLWRVTDALMVTFGTLSVPMVTFGTLLLPAGAP